MDAKSVSQKALDGLSEADLASFRREHLGFIFQEYDLLDFLMIYENMALALTIKETLRLRQSNRLKSNLILADESTGAWTAAPQNNC